LNGSRDARSGLDSMITRVITPRGSWSEVFALRAGAAQSDRPANDEGPLRRGGRDVAPLNQRRAA
jgi:hypothetical protein